MPAIARTLPTATLVLAAAGCAEPAAPDTGHAATSIVAAAATVRRAEVCFTVHNPGDPQAAHVRGTRWLRSNAPAGARAIVLAHGVISTRAVWHGMGTVPSMAETLARAGYAVFAIDRLGYGASPYDRGPGAGWSLTPDAYVAMSRDIAAAIRNGGYRVLHATAPAAPDRPHATDACTAGRPAGTGHRGVVLAGHSIAGAEAVLHAARYHDVDAVISIGWSNHGVGSTVGAIFGGHVLPQFEQGIDYVTFFAPGPAHAAQCAAALFHLPGADPDVVQLACAEGFFGTSPSGEVAAIGGALQAQGLAAIPQLGPTPVLLAFAEQDAIFPAAGHGGPDGTEPDVVTPEIAYWRSNCGCDLDIHFQRLAGHAHFFHRSAADLAGAIVAFLGRRGL